MGKAATGNGTPGPAPPTTVAESEEPKLPLRARLKESCVRPGGSQSITIRSKPDAAVGYDSVYADGKSGMMEGHYGGNMGGFTDKEGEWRDTWVVAAHAPSGPVQVNVLGGKVGYRHAEETLHFTVADVTGRCE